MEDTYGKTDVHSKDTLKTTSSKLFFIFRHGKGRLSYPDGK